MRMRRIESVMLLELRHFAASWKLEISRAQSPEERAKFEQLLSDVEQQIKEAIEAGIKEPKEGKEVNLRCR